MNDNTSPFSKGDWIVHAYYGVGQIKSIENKIMGDTSSRYYKVEARNSTFFVPVKNTENDRIRPVASKTMLQKAINALKADPVDMENDHNQRKRQISEMLNDCSLLATAELIRDLLGRRRQHRLNDHEESTLSQISHRLVREWSISCDISMEEAQQKFEDTINKASPA